MEVTKITEATRVYKIGEVETRALRGVNLAIENGEFTALVGPSGSGKTTLLRLIWGFLRPDEGTIRVFERQPHLNQMSLRLRTGYLAENPFFYGWMTAQMHLQFVSEFYGTTDARTVDDLLTRFGIPADTRIEQLSHGGRIELALVSALSHNPRLLLLDEPITSLDPTSRQDILGLLGMLSKEQGVGIVVTTRTPEDLRGFADSVLTLSGGAVELDR